MLQVFDDDDDKPYVAKPDDPESARIDGSQAVRLVHKYIQKIPVDRFTRLTPVWREEYRPANGEARDQLLAGLGLRDSATCAAGYVATCLMPHKTPFTAPVSGRVRPSKKAAKRDTAKLICQELHRRAELDDRLKIRKRKKVVEDDEEEDEDEYNPNSRKAGTRKKRRFYLKQYPEELQCEDSGQHYLQVINIKLTKENRDTFKYKFYHPEQDSSKFGIISSSSSIPCGPFQLFPPSGEHEVFIEASRPIMMENSLREKVERFQSYLWSDVLKVSEQMDVSDAKEILLVPMKGSSVDFDLLERVSSSSQTEIKEDSVIYPSYKAKKENYFIEEFVPRTLLDADNKMPGETVTFREHFQSVHNISLQDPKLIRPSSADKKSYVLLPSTEQGKKSSKKDLYDTTLFPVELMGVEPLSGGLWRQAQLLPAILHRLESLTACAAFLRTLGYQDSNCFKPETLPSPSEREFHELLQFDKRNGEAPSPGDILTAVTLRAANDVFDMERLEILGDSFLKYYTGVFLYYKLLELEREDIVTSEEGDLTSKRSLIVGNKNLFKVAGQVGLERIVVSAQLETDTTWQPPGLNRRRMEETLIELDTKFEETVKVTEGGQVVSVGSLLSWTSPADLHLLPQDGRQLLSKAAQRLQDNSPAGVKMKSFKLISDKSLADCVESLIGSFLLRSGQAGDIHTTQLIRKLNLYIYQGLCSSCPKLVST